MFSVLREHELGLEVVSCSRSTESTPPGGPRWAWSSTKPFQGAEGTHRGAGPGFEYDGGRTTASPPCTWNRPNVATPGRAQPPVRHQRPSERLHYPRRP